MVGITILLTNLFTLTHLGAFIFAINCVQVKYIFKAEMKRLLPKLKNHCRSPLLQPYGYAVAVQPAESAQAGATPVSSYIPMQTSLTPISGCSVDNASGRPGLYQHYQN